MYFHINNFLCYYSLVHAIEADDVMFPKIQEILLGGQKSHFQKLQVHLAKNPRRQHIFRMKDILQKL